MRRRSRKRVEVELDEAPDSKVRKARKVRRAADASACSDDADARGDVAGADAGAVSRTAPDGWERQLAQIQEMRKARSAPVDTMGCEAFRDAELSEEVAEFHVFVGALLSSQTKDEVTSAAMDRLRALDGGLTIESIQALEQAKLEEVLCPVGFYRNKAKFLKGSAALMAEEYAGRVPRTLKGLVKLPGIGPKMAHLIMTVAFGQTEGICVDIHVHRIANRLGWVQTWTPKRNDGPEATREELESWLPRDHWATINPLLVGFGQTVCAPARPSCASCAVRETCPSAFTAGTGSPSPRKSQHTKSSRSAGKSPGQGKGKRK